MDNTQTTQSQKLTPRFFFVSAGVLISLITVVVSFLNLVFEALNKRFPDVLNATYTYGYNTYEFTAMRSALAILIIVFPVFLVLSSSWSKIVREGLGRIDMIIKKWMLYLVVFLSSVVIVVDLITLVQYFVSGEITTRFILKVLVTLCTAFLVGIYYFRQIRDEAMSQAKNKLAGVVASIVVLGLVIMSFMVMGSPFQQRDLRLDDRRIQDLQTIQYQVINYWQQKSKLPEKMSDLSNPISGFNLPVDPEFEKGRAYEYKKTADMTFELCATFSLPIPKGWQENNYGGAVRPAIAPTKMEDGTVSSMPYPGGYGMNESWSHDKGYTCFSRTIDKDLYPPYPKPVMQ